MKNVLRQQLREDAKNHPVTMGVLQITNIINGKQYIKGALNLEALVNKINFSLNIGQFTHPLLQKEWTEYGSEAFIFEFATVIHVDENPYINYRQEISKAEQALTAESTAELY
ncbi:MAG: GIY-YIG nuclease family protein [Chryseobacterium sp.]|jgi:hypothetical protein|uniref:GIY-YIG nuclease family protein n=1 Tax=Chryseobacterium sp. TaxID=1871047 RepID=UPI00282212A9|nr:GIY-YIG nuclease family protein [Chryseobacterium sp.]MDR2238656.1 GIY-YIG nuclease family protein [Chryseobacterium sp.]